MQVFLFNELPDDTRDPPSLPGYSDVRSLLSAKARRTFGDERPSRHLHVAGPKRAAALLPRHPRVHQKRRRLRARPGLRDHRLTVAPHVRVRHRGTRALPKRPAQTRARRHESAHDAPGCDVYPVQRRARALEPRGEHARAPLVHLLARFHPDDGRRLGARGRGMRAARSGRRDPADAPAGEIGGVRVQPASNRVASPIHVTIHVTTRFRPRRLHRRAPRAPVDLSLIHI